MELIKRTCLPEASLSDYGDQLEVVDTQGALKDSMKQSVSGKNTSGPFVS